MNETGHFPWNFKKQIDAHWNTVIQEDHLITHHTVRSLPAYPLTRRSPVTSSSFLTNGTCSSITISLTHIIITTHHTSTFLHPSPLTGTTLNVSWVKITWTLVRKRSAPPPH